MTPSYQVNKVEVGPAYCTCDLEKQREQSVLAMPKPVLNARGKDAVASNVQCLSCVINAFK